MFNKLSDYRVKLYQLALSALAAVTLAACGRGGTASTTSTSAASMPPVVNGTPPTTVTAGAKYQYIPSTSDPNGRSLSYDISNKPDWATFAAGTGELSGTPDVSDAGMTAEIVIDVSDGIGLATIGPFRIRIIAPTAGGTAPAAPTIAGTPLASVIAGHAYSFIPTVTNVGNEQLSFAVVNRPAWASFSTATGELSGTPTSSNEGSFANILISVSGGGANVALPAFAIQVLSADGSALTISGTPATTVAAGSAYAFTPQAGDVQGSTLTFSVANAPVWASFSGSTGQLSGTPSTADAGTYSNIVITVSDGTVTTSLPPFSIEVQSSGNDTMSISGIPAASVVAGSAYAFTPHTTDPSGNALTFSIQALPSWATFSASTGELSGAPSSADVGTFSNIVISATDGNANASLPTFSIQVRAQTEHPPTISGTPAASVVAGSSYLFRPSASDPEGNPLTFSVTNLPSWAAFNSQSGTLSGTPGTANAGTYANIVISVSDGIAGASLAAFSITVTQGASGGATLNWSAPTQNTNGTALTNLAGFNIYYGTSANNLAQSVQISDPGTTTYGLSNLASGTWFFSINAYTTTGAQSVVSNVASKTIP